MRFWSWPGYGSTPVMAAAHAVRTGSREAARPTITSCGTRQGFKGLWIDRQDARGKLAQAPPGRVAARSPGGELVLKRLGGGAFGVSAWKNVRVLPPGRGACRQRVRT